MFLEKLLLLLQTFEWRVILKLWYTKATTQRFIEVRAASLQTQNVSAASVKSCASSLVCERFWLVFFFFTYLLLPQF